MVVKYDSTTESIQDIKITKQFWTVAKEFTLKETLSELPITPANSLQYKVHLMDAKHTWTTNLKLAEIFVSILYLQEFIPVFIWSCITAPKCSYTLSCS